MAQQIQLRNDTTAQWEYIDPVLAIGEIGVDTTLGKFKIGDGTSTWTELQFQTANIADFVFDIEEGEGTTSRITVANHDMQIRTTRTGNQDADISIDSADDVWINANDQIEITSVTDSVRIQTDDGNYYWDFDENGRMTFPDGSIQSTAYLGVVPLPTFLDYANGRNHLPNLNTNFGWDAQGVWFADAQGGGGSYPIYTDFTIPQNQPTTVIFDVEINDNCNDVGVCFYVDGTVPIWTWNPDPSATRIAAQFDCEDLILVGLSTDDRDNASSITPGMYTITFAYDPTAVTDKATVSYKLQGSNQAIATLSINEALPTGAYRVGFAADVDSDGKRTYISNLTIDAGPNVYIDSLTNGDSGAGDLTLPVIIKDNNGDNFITFTRTGTGTARIATPQDDLSLRSARDITLFAGDDGPGNVYIGWGDATYTPNSPNRVATIGDIESAPKTYDANNDARYGTYQASGFTEVTTTNSTITNYEVSSADNYNNTGQIELLVNIVDGPDTLLSSLYSGSVFTREIRLTNNNIDYFLTNPVRLSDDGTLARWRFSCSLELSIATNVGYSLTIESGAAPIVWWDADNENPTGEEFSNSNFRGAKIEYHAYVVDGGTVIGTIYIANDSDDNNVTHIETSSGGSDAVSAIFWDRSSGDERQLSLYRIDGEDELHKIQWTAQMYYATEYYED